MSFVPRAAMAADSVLALEISGPVTVENGGSSPVPLQVGTELAHDDVLRTGAEGYAVLLIDDRSRLEVFPHSVMELADILPGEQNDMSMSLYLGRIVMDARDLAANDVVHTPLLTIGIRGTRFAVNVADDGASVVSVEHGRVQVSTERVGASDMEVQLDPGQEVEAVEPGQELTPREIIIRSFQEWDAYRQSRRQGMIEDLPQLAAHLEQAIDPELERLDWIKLQPMNRAEVLRELDSRLATVPAADATARSQIIMQTHMELAKTQGLPERFRAQRTRLRAIFFQAELYQGLIQSYFQDLGPGQAEVTQTLERIRDREEEIRTSEQRISLVFRESMTPVQEIFNRFSDQ